MFFIIEKIISPTIAANTIHIIIVERFSESQSRELLHNHYEKARYSKEGCSASEAAELKKLTL